MVAIHNKLHATAMVEDCPTISYLSQKLESLPLSDYFFSTKRSDQNINKDLIHTKATAVVTLPKPTWSFDFSKTFLDRHVTNEDFSKRQKTKNIIKIVSTANDKNNVNERPTRCHLSNNVNDNTNKESVTTCENVVQDSKQIPTRDIMKEEETEINTQRGANSLSPVYSDGLPSKSCVHKSPNKRKRSSEESLLYGEISFSRSWDLEVCDTRFRDIQRTLSYDEELLRCDEEIATFTSRSTSSARRHRSRPSIRLTCKSQPSTLDDFRIVQPRARKVKVIQLKPDLLKDVDKMNDKTKVASNCSLFSDTNNAVGNVFRPIGSNFLSPNKK